MAKTNPQRTATPSPRPEVRRRVPAFLGQLEGYRIRFGKLRGGSLTGPRPTYALGAGLDFRDFRPYTAGDDLRYLDWNAFGRLDHLFVKQFETFGELTANLILDRTPSMDFGGAGKGTIGHKLTFACNLAKAIGFVGLRNLDRVRVLSVPWLQGQTIHAFDSRAHLWRFLDAVDAVSPRPITEHSRSLQEVFRKRSHQDFAIVMADVQEPQAWFPFLRFLRGACAGVLLVHLLAPEEEDPRVQLGRDVELRDIEVPGRMARVRLTKQSLAAYRAELERHIGRVRAFCMQSGIGYLRLSTGEPMRSPLFNKLRQVGLFQGPG